MADDRGAEERLVLSMVPAGPGERRVALAAVLLALAVFAAVAPFARVKLPRIDAFIPAYEAALVINDLITAALLFGQFAIARSRALLVLACAYLFTALTTVAHALTFPGLFAPSGLLGAGAQSTAWLYMMWHAGFPAAVLLYARLTRAGGSTALGPAAAIMSSALVVLGAVLALTALATAGEALLPAIMQGNAYTPAMIFVVASVWSLSLLALLALLVRRPHSLLDLWLMVTLVAWLCDVALSAVLNAGRFDLGFYAGRIFGLFASSFVLVVLLHETIALYAALARSVNRERRERERRVEELRSELIHVSRVSELGQMVSALAHEVNQPLTAVGAYLSAAERLMQTGDPGKAQGVMAKAAKEATRASEIVQRLRSFIRKRESERRVEDLRLLIEEALSIALAGTRGGEVGVELRVDPAAALACVDKVQIQQVLLNLVKNAIEAMAEGGPRQLTIATGAAPGSRVELSVADTGPGLPAEVRRKLFQPFVTTKGSGMGVGLSICRSIVQAHEGELWAEDRDGGGTVFRFTVPAADAASRPSAAAE
jgi:signal transduction histidine kinase